MSWPSAYLLSLSLGAGVLDALSYLALGRVFTANMTGNTVLLGVALARHSGADAARSATALGGFCAGAACGAALIRLGGRWPRTALPAFVLEALALAGLIALWAAGGAHSERYGLIVAAAVAMGAQSAAVGASDVRGVNTTYMTGTLVNALARVVNRARGVNESREGPTLPGAAWATYGAGAVAGAFAQRSWHAGAVAIPLAIVCAVSVVARRDSREEQ